MIRPFENRNRNRKIEIVLLYIKWNPLKRTLTLEILEKNKKKLKNEEEGLFR